jgi:hypothetical protein
MKRGWLAWTALGIVIAATTWRWWHSAGTSDVQWFMTWMNHVMAGGPIQGYIDIHGDYPPGTSLVLWIAGHLAIATAHDPSTVLKFVLLGFLLVSTAILLVASRRPSLAAFAYGALVVNAFGLMYLDILTAPFVIGAIWAATTGRTPLMAGLLALACLMKWQPIFIMPFAIIYILRAGKDASRRRRQTMWAAAIAGGIAIVVVLVYGFPAVSDAFYRASRHNALSNFGANPLWILTWWFERNASAGERALTPEGVVSILSASRPILRALSLISLIAYVTILRAYWRSADRTVGGFVRFALAGYLVYFMCSAGVHENHLFLASLLSIALAWQMPRFLWVAVVLAVAANLNLVAFYGWEGGGAQRFSRGVDVTVWLALGVSIAVMTIIWRLTRSDARNTLEANPGAPS